MRFDTRLSRHYNLRKNSGDYNSANSLCGWWNFFETDQLKDFVQGQTNSANPISGALDLGAGNLGQIGPEILETPSFLKGNSFLRNASISVTKTPIGTLSTGFKVDNFPVGTQANANLFTLSITFKLLQHWTQQGEDSRICIAEISDQTNSNGRFALIYDNDGGPGGVPSISIQAMNDALANQQWNAGQASSTKSWSLRQQCRDWIHLVLVVNDPSFLTLEGNQDWANYTGIGASTGAAIYINGNRVTADVPGSPLGGSCTTAIISRILLGGMNTQFAAINAGIRNALQIGEFALWNKALTQKEIAWMYASAATSYNSGIISNPESFCGDCDHNSYPTIKRTSDYSRKGTKTPVFDDAGHYSMPTFGSEINYPTLLLSGAGADSAVGTLVASPNTLPTIYTNNPGTAGTETIGQANVVKNYKKCGKDKDSSDAYKPFNDSTAPTDVSTLTSHLAATYPGYSEDLGNRIIIDIDITPAVPHVMRVVTGSAGQYNYGDTFGSHGVKLPPEETTGLSYFNFKTMKYEPMGGRNSETGTRTIWNLPEEMSSSQYLDQNGITRFDNLFGAYNVTKVQCPEYSNFEQVPRIFQPYSSIVSHRSTFNHVFGGSVANFNTSNQVIGYNSFEFPAGRSFMGMLEEGTVPALGSTVFERKLGTAVLPSSTNFPVSPATNRQQARGYGGLSNTEAEFLPFADDISGYRWDAVYIKTASMIWNDANHIAKFASGSRNLSREFNRTFGSMGRPIVYSNWARNSMFHASSSQAIKLADYINDPFLLESFEVISDVTALRHQNPLKRECPVVGSPAQAVVYYSNTNNHVDCLTYFLLRQENRGAGLVDKDQKSKSSSRDLISFSNNIFASPYVGWDICDTTKDEVNVELASGYGFSVVPYAGARASRVFKVTEEIVTENVPAVDTFNFYKKSDGVGLESHGKQGVFFSSNVAVTDIGMPKSSDMDDANLPSPRWVTASVRTGGPKPVRVCSAYAQHSTPIMPIVAGEWRGPDLLNPGQPNKFYGVGLSFYGGSTQWAGGQGLWGTDFAANRSSPRKALACMGTFWPGGVTISKDKKPLPKLLTYLSSSFDVDPARFDSFTLPQAILGPSGAIDPNFDYRKYDEMVPPVFAASYERPYRCLLLGEGLRNDETGKIGGAAVRRRTIGPSLGAGFTPTSMFGFKNDTNNGFSHFRRSRNSPFYLDYELSGSKTKDSAYVLFPEDELVFGAQWSPADAAHRSFQEISVASNILSFCSQDPSNTTAVFPDYPPAPVSHRTGSASVSDFVVPIAGKPQLRGNIKASEMGEHAYRYIGYTETNDLKNVASASCTINSSPSILRLYGTLIKNQAQKYHSLPQQLTTLCVHEVVGNEPVLDQFEISSPSLLQTSAAGRLVSGSMNHLSFYGQESTEKGSGGPFGAGTVRVPRLGRGVRRSAEMGNLHDVGSVKRVRRAVDASEYYYDSLAPNVSEMWRIDGVTPMVARTDGFGLQTAGVGGTVFSKFRSGIFTVNMPELGAPAAGYLAMVNQKFARSFPFEPRYAGVTRLFSQPIKSAYHFPSMLPLTMYSASLLESTNDTTGYSYAYPATTVIGSPGYQHFAGGEGFLEIAEEKVQKEQPMKKITNLIKVDGSLAKGEVRIAMPHQTTPTLRHLAVNYVNANFELTGSTLTPLFGVGDNRNGVLDSYYYYLELDAPAVGDIGDIHSARLLSRKPRGYRYGMISAEPKKYSAVFRQGRYGQFRDMLEQRQYSATYIRDPAFVAFSRLNDGLQVRSGELDTGPIETKFRSAAYLDPVGTATATTPSNTNSSNLNSFASSSIPFYDGESRNRDGSPPTETVIVS